MPLNAGYNFVDGHFYDFAAVLRDRAGFKAYRSRGPDFRKMHSSSRRHLNAVERAAQQQREGS